MADTFDYQRWRDLVQERAGLWFGPTMAGVLESRLRERAGELGLRRLNDYWRRLERQPAEWDALVDALTVREGRFFRQPEVFAALEEEVLPRLIRRSSVAGRRELRIWSAGCGEGEELYSVAMQTLEAVAYPDRWRLDLVGTDLSVRSVELARAGRYHPIKLETAAPARVERWFEPAAGGASARSVVPALRERCVFRRHDLRDRVWDLAPQDVILCQNVLYYLPDDDARVVFNRLKATLAPGGVLIVGVTELAALESASAGALQPQDAGTPVPAGGGGRWVRFGTARAYWNDEET